MNIFTTDLDRKFVMNSDKSEFVYYPLISTDSVNYKEIMTNYYMDKIKSAEMLSKEELKNDVIKLAISGLNNLNNSKGEN